MTSALQTLSDHEIARGSTLMNITQQVAASIGTAVFSVLLTNGFKDSPAVGQTQAAMREGTPVEPGVLAQGLSAMSEAFGSSFAVAAVLVALVLVPAFFLPRRKPARQVEPGALVH